MLDGKFHICIYRTMSCHQVHKFAREVSKMRSEVQLKKNSILNHRSSEVLWVEGHQVMREFGISSSGTQQTLSCKR